MKRVFHLGCSILATVIIAIVGLLLCYSVQAQNTSDVVVHLDNSYAGGPVVWQILPPQGAVAVSNSAYLDLNALIEIRNLAQGWTYGIRVTRLDGTGPLCTNVTINGAEQNVTAALQANACGGSGGGGGGPIIQTNETPNLSQGLLDFQNSTETPAGKRISATNPSGGIEHFNLSNTIPSTGGSAWLGDLTGTPAIGQQVCFDTATHTTNCTPAIPAIPHTGASYTILSTDRGNVLGRSNSGSAMTDSIAAPGTTGFELGYYVGIKNFDTAAITLSSVGSVFNNGTGASATVTIPAQGYAYLYDTGTAYWVNVSSTGGGGGNVTCGQLPALTGPVSTSAGSCATSVIKTCMMVFGSQNGVALADADIAPQLGQCFVPSAATIIEIDVIADGGTPNVVVSKNHGGTISDLLSSALATGSSGAHACSKTAATLCLDGSTTASATLQNTSIAAGDYIQTRFATAGGTAKLFSVSVTWQ